MKNDIVWTAYAAAALTASSILVADYRPDLSVALGLSAVVNAILSLRA
jgi:hypothetical protein